MNFKKVVATIEILAITSVVSVGFSTWTIVETNNPMVNGTIEAENVINNNDYLDVKNIIFSDYYCVLNDSNEITEGGFFEDFIYDTEKANGNSKAKLYVDIDVNLLKWNQLVGTHSYSKIALECNLTIPGNIYAYFSSYSLSATYEGNGVNSLLVSSTGDAESIIWSHNINVNYTSSSALSSALSLRLSLVYTIDLGSNLNGFLKETQDSTFKGLNFKMSLLMKGDN